MPYALPSPTTSPNTVPLSLSRTSSSSSVASSTSSSGRRPTHRNHVRGQSASDLVGLGYFPSAASASTSSSSATAAYNGSDSTSSTMTVTVPSAGLAPSRIYLQPATPPAVEGQTDRSPFEPSTSKERRDIEWEGNGVGEDERWQVGRHSRDSSGSGSRSEESADERDRRRGSGEDSGSGSGSSVQLRRPPHHHKAFSEFHHHHHHRARTGSEADAVAPSALRIDLNHVHRPLRSAMRHPSSTSVHDHDYEPSPPSSAMPRKKSGELVRPSLKTGEYSRARSAPSTPTCPKYVHFDTQLEHVKLFLAAQRPAAVSRDGSPVETETEDDSEGFPFPSMMSELPPSVQLLLPNFPTKASRDPNAEVTLEVVEIAEDRKSLRGTIQVANIAFHKSVAIRFTFDDWQTVSEVSGEYASTVEGGQADRFNFHIKLQDLLARLEEKVLFLAVRYHAGGREMWDNNGGANYRVEFKRAPKQPKMPLPWAIATASDLKKELDKLAEDEVGQPKLKVKGAGIGGHDDHVRAQPAASTPLSNRYDWNASLRKSGPPQSVSRSSMLSFAPYSPIGTPDRPFTRPPLSPSDSMNNGSSTMFINGMPVSRPRDEDLVGSIQSSPEAVTTSSQLRPTFTRRRSASADGSNYPPDFGAPYGYTPAVGDTAHNLEPFPTTRLEQDPGSRSHSPYFGMPVGGDREEGDVSTESARTTYATRFNSFPPSRSSNQPFFTDYAGYLNSVEKEPSSPPPEKEEDAEGESGESGDAEEEGDGSHSEDLSSSISETESEDTETEGRMAGNVLGRASSPPPPLTQRSVVDMSSPTDTENEDESDMRSPELTDTNTTNSSLGSPQSPSASPPSPAAFQLVSGGVGGRPPMSSPSYFEFVDKYCFFQSNSPTANTLSLTDPVGGLEDDPRKPRALAVPPVHLVRNGVVPSPGRSPLHSPAASLPPSVTSSPPLSRSPSSTGSSTPSPGTRSPSNGHDVAQKKQGLEATLGVETAAANFARASSPFSTGLDGGMGMGMAGHRQAIS